MRRKVEQACVGDMEEVEAKLESLARAGAGGPAPRAWYAIADGVDGDDLASIDALLEERPDQLTSAGRIFAEDAEGPALEEARERVAASARAALRSDRLPVLWAAQQVLGWAKDLEARRAVLERIAELDPGNPRVAGVLERLDRPRVDPEEEERVRPTTILDPAERLAALGDASPGRGWERRAYWSAWVDAAEALGDGEALMEGARGLRRMRARAEAGLAFARGALWADRELRRAERWVSDAVDIFERPHVYQLRDAEARLDWRRDLAEALALRAEVRVARGASRGARRDLTRAIAQGDAPPAWKVRLGLLEPLDGVSTLTLLAEGLKAKPQLTLEVEEAAWDRVDAIIEDRGLWAPGGAVALVEGHDGPERAADLGSAPYLGDFRFTVDGVPTRLDDIEGPVVVDLWATWCGPCLESLPHLDALARRFEGRVRMLAVSVDEDEKAARDYVAQRGDAAFQFAFAGSDGMGALGVKGIPAMFVLDAEHRLVQKVMGYAPGTRQLDRAIERALLR